jgi:hypothetical protein
MFCSIPTLIIEVLVILGLVLGGALYHRGWDPTPKWQIACKALFLGLVMSIAAGGFGASYNGLQGAIYAELLPIGFIVFLLVTAPLKRALKICAMCMKTTSSKLSSNSTTTK